MKEGTLKYNEEFGHFCIVSLEENEILDDIEFGDSFQVKVGENWVDTAIQIDQSPEGDLVFKLKNTPYSGNIEELTVRK